MATITMKSLLLHANSHDNALRGPAEANLAASEKTNFSAYISALCQELGEANNDPVVRQLAGLLIKNSLVSKEEHQREVVKQRWIMLAENVRNSIKQIVMTTLSSSLRPARQVAANIVSKIAAIELPLNMWQNLIEYLLHNLASATAELQESTFEALGFVCEECPDQLQASSGSILTAISVGMKHASDSVKLAATVALVNSLEFARNNMQVKHERDMIVSMIFSVASSNDQRVRVACFECLVKIATLYYDHIGEYMQDIFMLTQRAIQSETEEVAMQAIEFWSSICDEEILLQELAEEAIELERPAPSRRDLKFSSAVLQHLVPLLLQTISKATTAQDPNDVNQSQWDEASASVLCLSLLSQAVKDEIVSHVLPFIELHLASSDWHCRNGATLVFGSILDGPEKKNLAQLVSAAFRVMLEHMTDTSAQVRDSSAWTIGRICEVLPEIIDKQALNLMMFAFLTGLKDLPSIAAHVCWAIHSLAEAVNGQTLATSEMSQYFEGLVRALLEVTDRTDLPDARLLSSAYEAINALIYNSATDCDQHIQVMLSDFIDRIKRTAGSGEERSRVLLDLLCGSLQSVILRLGMPAIASQCESLCQLLLGVMGTDTTIVHEQGLMAIGSLASCMEQAFAAYMEPVKPFLLFALRDTSHPFACQIGVGVWSDICRALGASVSVHCDLFVNALLCQLQSPELERSVKPRIISCLGDVALSVGGYFDRYLSFVMPMLVQASQTPLNNAILDEDTADYIRSLRHSILEAYSSILAGLAEQNKASLFGEYINATISFLDLVSKDTGRSDKELEAAIGVIGDIAQNLGAGVKQVLTHPSIEELIRAGLHSSRVKTQENARWAMQLVR